MAEQVKDKRIFFYINTVIVFLLVFGVGFIEPFGQITPMGMKVLGVFLGVLYGWCTVGLLWPSLLCFVALGSTGYCTISEAVSVGFGNNTVLLIFFIFMLAAYCEKSGLSQWIANWFISRKVGEGRPWMFTILIFGAAYVMSGLVSMYATIVILWGIFYKICDIAGIPKKSKYASAVLAGIVMTCVSTGSIFPFKPFSAIVIGLLQKGTGGMAVEFVPWTVFHITMSICIVAGYLLFMRFILRPDVTAVKAASLRCADMRGQKMNALQKRAAGILVLFLLIIFLPSFLPKSWAITTWLNNVNVIGGVSICMILLSLIVDKEGKCDVSVPKLISSGTDWQLLILLASTMPLADALEAEEVGILTTIIGWLNTMFSQINPALFVIVVGLVFLLATQVAHNMILMIVFIPVLTKMALSYGVNPILVASIIFVAANTAFLTPAASANAALIFGNTDWVETKQAYLYGFAIVVVGALVISFVGVPLGTLLFV